MSTQKSVGLPSEVVQMEYAYSEPKEDIQMSLWDWM